jgi:SdpC family antimicrobial peptide
MILQTIHKRVSNLSFMAILAMLMMFVTFESQARTVKALSYSGEALFEGIFFAEGEVAAQIPELSGMNAKNFVSTDKERQEIDAFRAFVVDYVNDNYPEYMGDLENAVSSRSHVKIDQVLKQGHDIMEAAVNASSYERDVAAEQKMLANLEGRISEDMSTEEVKAEIQAEINASGKALGIYACVAVLIFFILVLFIFLPVLSPGGTLLNEAVVDSITKL